MSLSINVESATKCMCAFLQSIEMGRSKRIGNKDGYILKKVFFMIEVSNRRFQLKMCYVDITYF